MPKTALLLLFFLLATTLASQNTIVNILSSAHQPMKGTKLSLVPPESFVEAENFLGLQHTESGSSIMLLNIPGPYSSVAAGINKQNMLRQGVEMTELTHLFFNGLPAMFIRGKQKAYGQSYIKYVLIFGSEEETILINGVFPKKEKVIGQAIERSMRSTFYEPNREIDPFEALDYLVDVAGTNLQFATAASNALLFTVDGLVPTLSEDKTNLVVAKSFSSAFTTNYEQCALDRLYQMPLSIDTIEYTRPISIDGLDGYEILATAKDEETEEVEQIYQVMLFSEDIYYLFLGTTKDQSDNALNDMKRLIGSFKRKEQ